VIAKLSHGAFARVREDGLLKLVAETSSLGLRLAPRHFVMIGRKGEARFDLELTERDSEGDVVAFHYRPETDALRPIVAVVILND
jgi:hypothetical protein